MRKLKKARLKTIRSLFTVDELADVLDIDDFSARELLAGIIDFEINELIELANYKGISLEELTA